MKALTLEEFDRLGAAGVYSLVEDGKESVGLINQTTGRVSMVVQYLPPIPTCDCPRGLRNWVCLHCDGAVSDP